VKNSGLERDKAMVEERRYEEYREFNVSQQESENLKDLANEMSLLECN
jgi:hypothetical protein